MKISKLIIWCLTAICLTTSVEAATCGDLLEQLNLLVDETDSTDGGSHWTNTQKRLALNMSQQVIAPMVGCVEDDTTLALVGKRIEYSIPTVKGQAVFGIEGVWKTGRSGVDAFNYQRIEYTAGRNFGRAADSSQSKLIEQKRILEYKWHERKLGVFPAQETYSALDSLKVDLYRYPVPMTNDSSTFELPEYATFAVVKLAEYILQNHNLSTGEEAGAYQNIDAIAKTFIERFAKRREAVQ